MRSAGRLAERSGARASNRIVFIGGFIVFPDRPRHGLAVQTCDRRRGAPRHEIDAVHFSNEGGAQILGIRAGAGAWERHGD